VADPMQVALAYPWTDPDGADHAPDEVVSVAKAVGRRLIRDGRARPVEGPPAKKKRAPRARGPARPKPTKNTYPGPTPTPTTDTGGATSEGDKA
jgi:hypothetical protein